MDDVTGDCGLLLAHIVSPSVLPTVIAIEASAHLPPTSVSTAGCPASVLALQHAAVRLPLSAQVLEQYLGLFDFPLVPGHAPVGLSDGTVEDGIAPFLQHLTPARARYFVKRLTISPANDDGSGAYQPFVMPRPMASDGAVDVTMSHVAAVFEALPGCTALDLRGVDGERSLSYENRSEAMAAFRAVPEYLASLTIVDSTAVSDASLQHIAHCKGLTCLHLEGRMDVSDEALVAALTPDHYPRLRSLTLRVGVDVEFCRGFAGPGTIAPQLTALDLAGTALPPEVTELVAACPQLTSIDLGRTSLSSPRAVVVALVRHKRIKHIGLACEAIDAGTITQMVGTGVESLCLDSCRLDGLSVMILADIRSLTSLSLYRATATTEDIRRVVYAAEGLQRLVVPDHDTPLYPRSSVMYYVDSFVNEYRGAFRFN